MIKKIIIADIIMYSLLFVSIFTSDYWNYTPACTEGELFRFDRIFILGQANIYHLFAGLFFLIVFFAKFGPDSDRDILGDTNFLKNIFWMYFIFVNILLYLGIYIKSIHLEDLGISPIVKFFMYLVFIYYVQDVFLKNKDSKQLNYSLTILELIILFRCCYSIIKYFFGFGAQNPIIGGVRLGQESDFADFFILLFAIALTRLLFGKNKNKLERMIHISGIIMSSSVAIFSFRRYFFLELVLATGIILFFHYRLNILNFHKKIIALSLLVSIILSLFLLLGGKRLINNYYIGRFISSLSLISYRYESQFGTGMGHTEEIRDGWYNVKKNWFFGVTPFGSQLVQRYETREWQSGLFIHNAYLYIWLTYGFLGVILFLLLYLKSLQLGGIVFFKFKNEVGLILMVFMVCQIVKNIVWPTAILHINLTLIYILLISLVLKEKRLEICKNKY